MRILYHQNLRRNKHTNVLSHFSAYTETVTALKITIVAAEAAKRLLHQTY